MRTMSPADLCGAPGRLLLAVLLACVAASGVMAQEARSVGRDGVAEVVLEVQAELLTTLRLRLGAEQLLFDLRDWVAEDAPVCLAGAGRDVPLGTAPDGGEEVAPAGTTVGAGTWPAIELAGGRPLTTYPPEPAALAAGIVCFRSFELSAFANLPGWQLVVGRTDREDGPPFPSLYVTSVCPGEPPGGLLALLDGHWRSLRNGGDDRSCGDMLVVVAVRIDQATAGRTVTDLQYTLLAADADLASE